MWFASTKGVQFNLVLGFARIAIWSFVVDLRVRNLPYFNVPNPGTSVEVSAILLGLVLVGRTAFVFPLSFLSNLAKNAQHEKIDFRQQVLIWWAGLMRGAVSMALAYNQFTKEGHTTMPGNAIMITSTITVVLFSTMVNGQQAAPQSRLDYSCMVKKWYLNATVLLRYSNRCLKGVFF
ncbi:putative cation/H+ exchanger, cation/H+ exchanger, CPA1 family [Helianthus debilis subsp. tardiflorus]